MGVVQDYKEAVKWDELAAEQGNSQAWYFLGEMYYKGPGVGKNYKIALSHFTKCAQIEYAQYHINDIEAFFAVLQSENSLPDDFKDYVDGLTQYLGKSSNEKRFIFDKNNLSAEVSCFIGEYVKSVINKLEGLRYLSSFDANDVSQLDAIFNFLQEKGLFRSDEERDAYREEIYP